MNKYFYKSGVHNTKRLTHKLCKHMKRKIYILTIIFVSFFCIPKLYAQTDIQQIESLFNMGKYEEAIVISEHSKSQTGKMHFWVYKCYCKLNKYANAKEHLIKSANTGLSQALYELGKWYLDGGMDEYYEKSDTIKAEEIFKRLFSKDDSFKEQSLYEILNIYEDKGDKSKEKPYIEKAITKNIGYAFFVKAISNENGERGYEYDEEVAIRNYELAIKYSELEWVKGEACTRLGILKCKKQKLGWAWSWKTASWLNRDIQPQNVLEQDAAKLWKEAISHGERRRAPYLLAIHQYETIENYSKAMSLFRLSADNGYTPAQCKMGKYFEEGTFVAQDFQEATKWYTLAANNGDGEAELHLGLCYEQLYRKSNDERMLKSALKYFYRADKHGYARKVIEKKDKDGYTTMKLVHPALPLYEEGVLNSNAYNKFEEWNDKVLASLAIDSDVDIDIPKLGSNDKYSYALIIANENYLYEEYVPYAENDGVSISKYLQWCIGLPEDNIHVVKDASLNKMRWEIDWLNQIINSGLAKRIYFYYVGHGMPAENQQTSYLLPVDGYAKNISTGFDINDIVKKIESETATTYCFIDACFSGGKRKEGMLVQSRGVAIKPKDTEPEGKTIMIMACQNDESAYAYDDKKHGLFTYFLLKELKNSMGNICLGNLYESVMKNVKQTSLQINHKQQTPNVFVSKSFDNWKSHKLK